MGREPLTDAAARQHELRGLHAVEVHDLVAAVTAHMNTDHPEDNLLIVRALGGIPEASGASMTGYDETGAHFEVTAPAGTSSVTVPWSEPILERGTIRREVVRMYNEACSILGVTARGEGDH